MRYWLLLFALIAGSVQSQSPVPAPIPTQSKGSATKQEQGTKADEKSCEDKNRPYVSPVTVNVSPTQTLTEQPNRKENRDERQSTAEWLAALSTLALAVITAFLAYFTYWLWRSTGNLVKGAEDTAKKELRAYVGIQEVTVRRLPEGIFQAVVTVVNGGRTPANAFRRFLNVGVFDVTHTRFKVEELSPPLSMPPNTPMPIRRVLPSITNEDIERVSAPDTNRHVFVWGRIEYEDVYKEPHYIDFRFLSREVIRGYRENAPPVIMGWALHPAEDGNEAT